MNQGSILLLGTDGYVAEECVSRGLRTVVVRNASAMPAGGRRLPDSVEIVYVEDSSSVQEILLSLASRDISLRDFDAIQSSNEFCLIVASVLADRCSFAGIPVDTSVVMRNKYLQNAAVRLAKIPAAQTCLLVDSSSVESVLTLRGPLIIKPIAGASATSTRVVESANEGVERLREMMLADIFVPQLICQEIIQGQEFMIDGVIHGGSIAFASMALCASNWLSALDVDAVVETHRVRDKEYPGLPAKATAFASDVLEALGYRDGIFHLEGFLLDDGSLVFGECAGRRGGVLVEEEIRLQHGVSLASAAVDLAFGLEPCLRVKEQSELVGTTYLRLQSEGVVIDLPARAEMMLRPGVHFIRYDSYIGGRSTLAYSSSSERAAMAMLSAADIVSLRSRMKDVRDYFCAHTLVVPTENGHDSHRYQEIVLGRKDLSDVGYAGHLCGWFGGSPGFQEWGVTDL